MAIAQRLAEMGHQVRAASSRSSAREGLARAGVEVCDSPARAAQGADICVAVVFSEAQLREALLGDGQVLASLPPGALVLSHVTASVDGVRELAERTDARGVGFVDAPISGTPEGIRSGVLTVLLGGTPLHAERAAALLSHYANVVLDVGPVGHATHLKLLNNVVFAAQAQVAEAVLRVAEAAGISRDQVVEVLTHSTGSSGAVRYVREHGPHALETTVRYLDKDVALFERLEPSSPEASFLAAVAHDGPLDVATAVG
jgi:3-hydroxyisobutyrate dehydrogenase-like beta-hydroxyacid dehydrogenase